MSSDRPSSAPPSLFDDPEAHARTVDPETSKIAARSARYADAWRVLEAYRHFQWTGLTDHEAYRIAGMDPSGARQRCSDLRARGYTEPTGRVGLSPSGRPARVCKITPEGLAALEELGR
jgi:hypothetical protein